MFLLNKKNSFYHIYLAFNSEKSMKGVEPAPVSPNRFKKDLNGSFSYILLINGTSALVVGLESTMLRLPEGGAGVRCVRSVLAFSQPRPMTSKLSARWIHVAVAAVWYVRLVLAFSLPHPTTSSLSAPRPHPAVFVGPADVS